MDILKVLTTENTNFAQPAYSRRRVGGFFFDTSQGIHINMSWLIARDRALFVMNGRSLSESLAWLDDIFAS